MSKRKTPHFLLVTKQIRNLVANLNMDFSILTDDQLAVVEYEAETLREQLADLEKHFALRATIEKLERMDGRTPAEGEAFKAKAAELRAKHRLVRP